MSKPLARLAVNVALSHASPVTLTDNAAHYLTQVLRLRQGDAVMLFARGQGEWRAQITQVTKKQVTLALDACVRAHQPSGFHLTVCFAPIKGGRMDTIIEKATELGATTLQPVITRRSIVDRVNLARAEAVAREAAEQCERMDWPEIREPVKLPALLGSWPATLPLFYGDESGGSSSIHDVLDQARVAVHGAPRSWAVLVGPEGGFTPEEFALLSRIKTAKGVALGPRILRADTAIITLCALTCAHWGDWAARPRFINHGEP